MRSALLATFTLAITITVASAADRKPITCETLKATDGDTIKCNGILMRDMGDGAPFVKGYDTPEIQHRKCQKELELARVAKKRMAKLLATPGVQIFDSGVLDRSRKRPLVWVILPDGVPIGRIMIKEGLAKEWTPNYVPNWCG
jgi:micrococcal nuclease